MGEYGTIRIKLDELIKEAGLSNNSISRLDIDVLARICTVLECEIGDLLEFIPPEKGK